MQIFRQQKVILPLLENTRWNLIFLVVSLTSPYGQSWWNHLNIINSTSDAIQRHSYHSIPNLSRAKFYWTSRFPHWFTFQSFPISWHMILSSCLLLYVVYLTMRNKTLQGSNSELVSFQPQRGSVSFLYPAYFLINLSLGTVMHFISLNITTLYIRYSAFFTPAF